MVSRTICIAAISVSLLVAAAASPMKLARRQDGCAAAYEMCIFTFEGANGLPTYQAGTPGVAISPQIIYKDGAVVIDGPSPSGGVSPIDDGPIVGSVDATAEAYVITDAGPVLISDFECPSQSFSSAFFKAANLGSSSLGFPISGASHETPQGDQVDCLDGLCVVLTLQKWQSFTSDGVLNIVSPPEDFLTNCAVFRLEL